MVRLACIGMVGALMVCSAGAEVMTSTRVLDLSGKWTLRQEDDPGQPAVEMAVPGGVHTALLAAGRIPDPFFGQNEKAVQWVGQKDWRVERRFTVPTELLACRLNSPAESERPITMSRIASSGRRKPCAFSNSCAASP